MHPVIDCFQYNCRDAAAWHSAVRSWSIDWRASSSGGYKFWRLSRVFTCWRRFWQSELGELLPGNLPRLPHGDADPPEAKSGRHQLAVWWLWSPRQVMFKDFANRLRHLINELLSHKGLALRTEGDKSLSRFIYWTTHTPSFKSSIKNPKKCSRSTNRFYEWARWKHASLKMRPSTSTIFRNYEQQFDHDTKQLERAVDVLKVWVWHLLHVPLVHMLNSAKSPESC